MADDRPRIRWRNLWAGLWAVFAWFALLRASFVQWSVPVDSSMHAIRVATAFAVVVPILAYAIHICGRRLRFSVTVAVLNVHVIAIACLRDGFRTMPALAQVAWPFGGIALGAILAAVLERSAARTAPKRPRGRG